MPGREPTRSVISVADRSAGGLIGLLVGDALGVPYEFHSAGEIPPPSAIEFEPPPGFARTYPGVLPGTWSDDGAQALVLLASLLDRDGFDADHFARGLIDWRDRGYMAVDGQVFDVGIQTESAIGRLRTGVAALEAGAIDERSNGNGALMRVLPLALCWRGTDPSLVEAAFDQSSLTHGHVRSKLCCALYCLWARNILRSVDRPWEAAVAGLRAIFPDGSVERSELEQQILGVWTDIAGGSGYVVDSLHAARWANRHSDYEAAVKAAVALGEDTDTTACIAGGIAGLRFGVEAIPERWRTGLRGREIYQPLLNSLIERLSDPAA